MAAWAAPSHQSLAANVVGRMGFLVFDLYSNLSSDTGVIVVLQGGNVSSLSGIDFTDAEQILCRLQDFPRTYSHGSRNQTPKFKAEADANSFGFHQLLVVVNYYSRINNAEDAHIHGGDVFIGSDTLQGFKSNWILLIHDPVHEWVQRKAYKYSSPSTASRFLNSR